MDMTGKYGDREMMTDALASQKLLTDNYNLFTSEIKSPSVMADFMNILADEHKIGHDLFGEMSKRGWYPTETAEQQKVAKARDKFTGTKR